MGAVIEAGDKVRVVWEGIATQPINESVLVQGAHGRSSAFVPVSNVEIVEKKKPKLGDVISNPWSQPEALDALPIGAVLRSGGREHYLKTELGWVYSGTGKVYPVDNMSAPRTIVYLPEGKS